MSNQTQPTHLFSHSTIAILSLLMLWTVGLAPTLPATATVHLAQTTPTINADEQFDGGQ